MLEYERKAWAGGHRRLAGVDEAGRGPLAGPVVAAALTADPDFLQSEIDGVLATLTDSKKLSEKRRDAFFDLLDSAPEVEFAVGICSAKEVDNLNILRATHLAMRRAVEGLSPLPDHVLVDGLPVKGLPVVSTAIVKGDSKSLLIAAASIIAKVTRDQRMRELDAQYPAYGFAGHKGYGTKSHMAALLKIGPCPEHRRSFRPVREAAHIHQRGEEHPR